MAKHEGIILYSTTVPTYYDENGNPCHGVTTMNEEEQLNHRKNKHVFLIPEEKIFEASELLRSAGII